MRELQIKTNRKNEFVNITRQVQEVVSQSGMKQGLCTVYVPHTTAGVTINEGADPDVARDMLMALENIVQDTWPYRHMEGNSPSHIKASLMGSSVTVIVQEGRLQLGAWQSIFFCEFDGPRHRRCWVHLIPGA